MGGGMRVKLNQTISPPFLVLVFCLTFAISTAPCAKEGQKQNTVIDLNDAPLASTLNYRPPATVSPKQGFSSAVSKPVPRTEFIPPHALNNPKPPPQPPPIESLRLLFWPESAELLPASRPLLDDAVKLLQTQPESRMRITAYAGGTPETASPSRRLSLARALAVRSFLTDNGVHRVQMDIVARGFLTNLEPKDRVDLDFIRP